jgi:biotin carboxyl carrier protein
MRKRFIALLLAEPRTPAKHRAREHVPVDPAAPAGNAHNMQQRRMKFVATMDGKIHELEVANDEGSDNYRFIIDGKAYDVDCRRMPSQIVSMIMDGKSYDVDLERMAKRSDTLDGRMHVRVRGRVLRFEMLDERRLKMKEAQGFRLDVGGVAAIDSPMPGKVIKLLKKPGDTVNEGEGIVVVEAMKMENELKAPKAGVVKEVRVKEGDTVEAGARLALVE